MKMHAVGWTVVAIFGAALASASAPAVAGKPAPPPTNPCGAAGLDFPAFTYKSQATNSKSSTIYVSDSSGKCSRSIATTAGSVAQPKFSYFNDPVASSTYTGRVVWKEGQSIFAVDFSVGAGNTVSVQNKRALYLTSGCCVLDLSEDGRTVYFTDTNTSISKLDVALPNNPPTSPTTVYALSDQAWYFASASVNGNETQLFATKNGTGADSGGSQLVRIDLATATAPATETRLRESLPRTGYGTHAFSPAANKHGEGVAFIEYIEGTSNCTPLVVTDNDGLALVPAAFTTERLGKFPTWVGVNVVMEPRASMVRLSCADTTSIAQVAPDGTETVLLTQGNRADGR